MVRRGEVERDRLGGAVLDHDAVEVPEHGISHGGVDADAGRRADDHEGLGAAVPQGGLQGRAVEPAVAVLVDDDVLGAWSESSTISVFQVSRIGTRLGVPSGAVISAPASRGRCFTQVGPSG